MISPVEEEEIRIRIGTNEINQSESARLLGVTMDKDQKWNSHVWGKNGLVKALNASLYQIRRLKNHLPKDKIKIVVDDNLSNIIHTQNKMLHTYRPFTNPL